MPEEQTSPVILKPENKSKMMDFPDAIREVIAGYKITRLEWDDPTSYGLLKDGFLQINLKGKLFRWMVNDGDMLAEDWVTIQ